MTSSAKDCEACETLGHPCRSHETVDAQEADPDNRPPACGRTGCDNPTLHSHKPPKPTPKCPYSGCWTPGEHSHTEEGGIQKRYAPRHENTPADPAHPQIKVTFGDVDLSEPEGRLIDTLRADPRLIEEAPGAQFERPAPGPNQHAAAVAQAAGEMPMPVEPDKGPRMIPSIEPDLSHADPFTPGSWVKVWAQVDAEQTGTHPDDLRMKMWTHNADNTVWAERTYVETTTDRPPKAWQCSHLSTYRMDPAVIVRCESYEGPGHEHRFEHQRWTDKDSIGYIEER